LDGVLMFEETYVPGAEFEPALELELLSDNKITLSWATANSSYTLQTTGNLKHPDWQPAAAAAERVGSRFSATLNVTDQAQYFRLQR
jgi:hypothetical protein